MAKNPIKHFTTAVYDHAVEGTITAGTPVVLADSGFVPAGGVITAITYIVAGAVTGGNVQLNLDPTDGSALVAVGGNTALSTAGKTMTDVRGAVVAKESKFALDCVSTNVTAGKINILIEYVMGLDD